MWRPQSRYTVSRIECRTKFPQNQRCRATIALHPLKSRCRSFLRTPLSHFPLVRSRHGARRAGGGHRGTFGSRKRIALQGGIAATVTPVALLCATKPGRNTPFAEYDPLGVHPDKTPRQQGTFFGFLPPCQPLGCMQRGSYSVKGVVLCERACFCLLSAF